MNKVEIAQRLQEPFPPEEIEWRVDRGQKTQQGAFVFVLAYVTNRAIMNRLDDVFGPFGWRNEFKEWKDTSQLCGISVWDSERSEWVTKWDGSDDSNMDKVKGGISGAMKRTAVQWGIGRYLYNLEQNRVPLKSSGENWTSVKVKANGKEEYVTGYWDTPKLPDWALPKGFSGVQKPIVETDEQEPVNPPNDDLNAIEQASEANRSNEPVSASETTKMEISEGQLKMLNTKASIGGWKKDDKEQLMTRASSFLGYTIDSFVSVKKQDVSKLAQYLDTNKKAS